MIILARALEYTGNTNTDEDLTPMHVRTSMTITHGTWAAIKFICATVDFDKPLYKMWLVNIGSFLIDFGCFTFLCLHMSTKYGTRAYMTKAGHQ